MAHYVLGASLLLPLKALTSLPVHCSQVLTSKVLLGRDGPSQIPAGTLACSMSLTSHPSQSNSTAEAIQALTSEHWRGQKCSRPATAKMMTPHFQFSFHLASGHLGLSRELGLVSQLLHPRKPKSERSDSINHFWGMAGLSAPLQFS